MALITTKLAHTHMNHGLCLPLKLSAIPPARPKNLPILNGSQSGGVAMQELPELRSHLGDLPS